MRGTGVSAAAIAGSASRSTFEPASESSTAIYPIGDYRKFYVREAREKIRSSASSLKNRSPESSHSRLSELSLLSDGKLLENVSRLRVTEKKIEISMLLYLIEVERRGLDLTGGYDSLFAFCTKHLKYSDSVAGRRIRTARCMRDYPAVYEYLSAGKVNVCNISLVAKMMTEKNHLSLLAQISGRSTSYVRVFVSSQQPARKIRDLVTPVKVFEKELVKASEEESGKADEKDQGKTGSPSGGSQEALSGLENPGGGQKLITNVGDKKSCSLLGSAEGLVKMVEKQKFKLQFAVSPEFMKKYEKIKGLMSTKHPGGIDFEGAFEVLMDEYIEKHSPEARVRRREERAAKKKVESAAKVEKVKSAVKAERTKRSAKVKKVDPPAGSEKAAEKTVRAERKAKTTKTAPSSEASAQSPGEPTRFIPQAIKDQIFKRDGGQCAYRGPDGRRCDSSWNLQVDHIIPFALGGSNSPENLQLLCRRHNQHKAIKDFGKKKIQKHSKRDYSKR